MSGGEDELWVAAARAFELQRDDARAFGNLCVRTTEPGSVFVDGEYMGEAPLEDLVLPCANYAIRVDNPSGMRMQLSVTVPARGRAVIEMGGGSLSMGVAPGNSIYGSMRFRSEVPMMVHVDDREEFPAQAPPLTTPGDINVYRGHHDLRFVDIATGKSSTQPITLPPGGLLAFELGLDAEGNPQVRSVTWHDPEGWTITEPPVDPSREAVMWLRSEPRGASLTVDGYQMGDAIARPVVVAAGPHVVRLVDPRTGHERVEAIILQPGERKWLELVLLPAGGAAFSLDAVPKGKVYVDGKCCGYTPIMGLVMEPSKHRYAILYPEAGVQDAGEVELDEGQTLAIRRLLIDPIPSSEPAGD